jgi:hypothetical protein
MMSTGRERPFPTKTLLLVTDAWRPQVNGLVTALEKMKEFLERDGIEVIADIAECHRPDIPVC